jgi:hypothetical protein
VGRVCYFLNYLRNDALTRLAGGGVGLGGWARRGRTATLLVCLLALASVNAFGQFQMPDPKQMAGIPRPVDDLPAGSVSVRLIRGQLSNNIADHPVELHFGNGRVLTVKTDEAGRAQFDKLPAGSPVKASADVDGEHLESQEFPAPAQGGIRLMLVATDRAAAAKSSAPAVAGQVALGGETRIVLEPGDEVVDVYYLLDIVNGASTPVTPATPFRFDMPAGALGTTLMDGSSRLAKTSGAHVTVDGPFPPGRTTVQVACQLPVTAGSMDIVQSFPANLERLAVLVKKVGDTKLTSAQLTQQRDIPNEGQIIIGAMGNAVAAGQPIALTLSELPHHSLAPRWTALSIAGLIILAGVWAGTRPDDSAREGERKRLIARREKLLAELVRLENDYRIGRGDRAKYASRREDLVTSLEHVYSALDDPDDPVGVAA